MSEKYILTGDHDEDVFLKPSDMTSTQWDILMGCYHQGQCESDTQLARQYFEVKDILKACQHVVECGVESDRFTGRNIYLSDIKREDITDEHAVIEYYLWLLAGDIQDRQLEESEE